VATLKYRSLPVAPAWSCMVEAPVRGCVQEARGTALEPMVRGTRGCVQEARGTGLELYG
jgi:hypothetical protein